ncbi:MAG: hypothetical protein SO182_03445 [Paludibacteraceae bacterium]|nr:hypothetical protein [Bacteroidales bacterium]MDY4850276.1 hypothetical protein [Paludibacteraceae bacterium]
MNANQRQSILDAIVEFEKADFETPFKNKYKDTATFDSIVIADYSIDELFAMAKRAIVQLKEFLDNGNWQVVPSDNIPMPIYGNITLRNVIVSFTNSFKSAAYEQAATQVKSLVYFEMRCGFWVQPKRVELGIRESSLKTLEQRAELTMSHIDARENKVKLLIDELELKKLEIEKLINTKRQELEALKNNQSESNVILEKIKGAQQTATSAQTAIETLNGEANNIVTALKNAQIHIIDQIEINKETISQSKKALEDFKEEATTKISKITSDFDSVSTNAEEVRKMMGYIADGTLSHSFNKRKEDLSTQITKWFWASVIIAVLAIGWVCVVFFWVGANTGSEWANILINGIKSSPLFFLLGFAISQYQKERNLMEEYAFRESVAVTLTAYLEQMPEKGDEEKRRLLLSTVEQLYTKPVIANKEYGLLKFDSKDLSETSKTLKELVEALLNRK